jgi:DNA-binding transcriptional LysR family regulator
MKIESHEISTFLAVVERGSFKQAAEELSVSNSAISQALANLEYKFGLPLIKRGKTLLLTEAGQRFLKYAQQVNDEERAMLEDVGSIKAGYMQKLDLMCNNTFASYFCTDILHKLYQQSPFLRVDIEVLPSRKMIYEILRGDKEVAVGPFQKNMRLYDTIELFTEQRFLVAHRSSPFLKELQSASYEPLKKVPLLTSYLDDAAQRAESVKIRDHFPIIWEIDNVELRLKLICSGVGVTYISSILYDNHPQADELVILKIYPFGEISRPFGIYYKKNLLLSESARNFIEICSAKFA